jgi:hypothetical protein
MTERIRPQCAAKNSLGENVLRAFNAELTEYAFKMSKYFDSDKNFHNSCVWWPVYFQYITLSSLKIGPAKDIAGPILKISSRRQRHGPFAPGGSLHGG